MSWKRGLRSGNLRVIWVGNVSRAALAVPCPTCNAEIGAECAAATHPAPHRERDLRAEVFGFRTVPDADGLFRETICDE